MWQYIFGYVIIEVNGVEISRFVNLCAKKGVSLHNAVTTMSIDKGEKSSIKFNVFAAYLDEVKMVAEKCNCHITVIKQGGILIYVKALKKRIFFLVGMAIFFLLFFAVNQFVWLVEIECDTIVDEKEIRNVLREQGVYESALKTNVNITKSELVVLKCDDRITWVDIREKGMKVVVRISKSMENPNVHDVTRPCHIVAKKRGIIEKITATVGRKKVNVGEAFSEGDVLVSGVLPLKEMSPDEEAYAKRKTEDGECLLVHSEADIQAKTWYDYVYAINEFQGVSFELDDGRNLIDVAYQRARKDLAKEAAKDCVIKAHWVKIIDGNVKITFECSENVGVEKSVSKEMIVRQKEFQLLREQAAQADFEKENAEEERKLKEKQDKKAKEYR